MDKQQTPDASMQSISSIFMEFVGQGADQNSEGPKPTGALKPPPLDTSSSVLALPSSQHRPVSPRLANRYNNTHERLIKPPALVVPGTAPNTYTAPSSPPQTPVISTSSFTIGSSPSLSPSTTADTKITSHKSQPNTSPGSDVVSLKPKTLMKLQELRKRTFRNRCGSYGSEPDLDDRPDEDHQQKKHTGNEYGALKTNTHIDDIRDMRKLLQEEDHQHRMKKAEDALRKEKQLRALMRTDTVHHLDIALKDDMGVVLVIDSEDDDDAFLEEVYQKPVHGISEEERLLYQRVREQHTANEQAEDHRTSGRPQNSPVPEGRSLFSQDLMKEFQLRSLHMGNRGKEEASGEDAQLAVTAASHDEED